MAEELSLHSWLDALSTHPILNFSSGRHAASSLCPSPNASSIHSLAGAGYDDEAEEDDTFVRSHRDVAPGSTAATAACCVARKSELCVASGSQIRILSLASFKAKQESNAGIGGPAVPSTPNGRAGPSSGSTSSTAGGYKVQTTRKAG
jgi:hypothetical protein